MTFGGYLLALLAANWREHYASIPRAAFLSGFMFVQNLIFFLLWIIFFGSVGQIGGWRLQDVSLLYGVVTFAVGLPMFLCDGVRTLPLRVQDGSFDTLIARPRHPLPALMFSRSSASSLGDLVSSPMYWFVFGGMSVSQLPMLLAVSLLGAAVFQAAAVLTYSLAFWLRGGGRLSEQLFEILIITASVPQHNQPLGIKLVLFTVIPAGFISLTPVTIMQDFGTLPFAGLLAAAAGYSLLAVLVFDAGVRRYIAQSPA